MHSAIKIIEVSVGRGTPKAPWPVITLGRFDSQAAVWHILDPNSPICNTRGVVFQKLEEQDANIARVEGRHVCGRCRSLLGPVPILVEKEQS